PASAPSAHQSRPVLRPPRAANHAGLLRRPRDLFFVAVVPRIFRNVTAALEISVVGAKHRASWRNRFLACLVARGRGSILSRASFSFALSLSPSTRGHHHSMPDRPRRNSAPHISRLEES